MHYPISGIIDLKMTHDEFKFGINSDLAVVCFQRDLKPVFALMVNCTIKILMHFYVPKPQKNLSVRKKRAMCSENPSQFGTSLGMLGTWSTLALT